MASTSAEKKPSLPKDLDFSLPKDIDFGPSAQPAVAHKPVDVLAEQGIQEGPVDPASEYGSMEAVKQGILERHRAAIDGATFGHADELLRMMPMSDEDRAYFDANPGLYGDASRSQPLAHTAGAVFAPNPLRAGSATSLLPEGARLARAATWLAQQGLAGAAEGVAQAHGDSDGLASAEQYADSAKRTAIGSIGGGLIGEGINAVARGAERWIPGFTDRQTMRAAGITGEQAVKMRQDMERALGRQVTNDEFNAVLSDEINRRGLVQYGDTPDTILQKADNAAAGSGSRVDASVRRLSRRAQPGQEPNATNVAQGIRQVADNIGHNPINQEAAAQLHQLADEYDAAAPALADFVSFWHSRRMLDDRISRALSTMDPTFRQGIERQLRGLMEQEMLRAAQEMSPRMARTYSGAKGEYAMSASLEEAARAKRDQALDRSLGTPSIPAGTGVAARGAAAGSPGRVVQGAADTAKELAARGLRGSPDLAAISRWLEESGFPGVRQAADMARAVRPQPAAAAGSALTRQPQPGPAETAAYMLESAPEKLGADAGWMQEAYQKGGRGGLARAIFARANGGGGPEFQALYRRLQDGSIMTE